MVALIGKLEAPGIELRRVARHDVAFAGLVGLQHLRQGLELHRLEFHLIGFEVVLEVDLAFRAVL